MSWVDRLLGRTSARASVAATLPQLPGGAPVGDVMPRVVSTQRTDIFATKATAGPALISAVRSADNGYMSSLSSAIDGALVRDSRLAGVYRARILAITSRRYAVRPPAGYETDRQALAVAQSVQRVLEQTPGFIQRRAELADGIGRHGAFLEHDWQIDRNGWRVSRPRRIDPSLINYDIASGQWTIAEGTLRGKALAEWPDKFIVHSPSGGLALPKNRRGALRPLLWLSLAKLYGFTWWGEALERYGQPQLYGTLPDNASNTLFDTVVEGLRNMSSQWAAVFRGDVKVNALPVSISETLHKEFVDFINTEYAVNLLGGNLATESRDGQVYGSQAQAQVRSDLLAADLVELDETIVDQWIEPVVRFNAPGSPVPVLESVVSQSRPLTTAEYQAGLCTRNEYRTSNGLDPVDGGDAFFVAPQLPSYAQGSPLAMPAPLALPSGGADAGAPFPRSIQQSSPTSHTLRSGPARSLSE